MHQAAQSLLRVTIGGIMLTLKKFRIVIQGFTTAVKYFLNRLPARHFIVACALLVTGNVVFGQCPPNIDFEEGTFTGWKLYDGTVAAVNGSNVITLDESSFPISGRHQIIGPNITSVDEFGGFSKHSPDGSNYSVKLGNKNGGQAEGISYEFTIPPGANQFSLTYYYAVVFEDPGHAPSEQPRLVINIENVTDNTTIGCSSFDFIASSGMPGFFKSPLTSSGTPIWCKDWAATAINLDGNAGKTIRIFFKTADCTFQVHFGYAYIDVSTQCGSSFVGASYCPLDPEVNITAPAGYQNYTWYNSDFSQTLGNTQTLTLTGAQAAAATALQVKLEPYNGYGCTNTLTAYLTPDLSVVADAGPDLQPCDEFSVQLGTVPVNNIKYSWSPTTGLSDPHIANPFLTVQPGTVTYTLTATSAGGGCIDTDDVMVENKLPQNGITLTGSASYCTGSGQTTVLSVYPADNIQWYKDDAPIPGATSTQYTVTDGGLYKAVLSSSTGCSVTTDVKQIDIYPAPAAAFTVDNASQCFGENQFVFTNGSTVASGELAYTWDFADGITGSTRDITHKFAAPGTYNVKLHITGNGGCFADDNLTVVVKPSATADFAVQPVCINLPLTVVNKTTAPGAAVVNYLWDFANTQTSAAETPAYSYSVPGTYLIKLSASTPECPVPTIKEIPVVIDAPAAAVRYADQPAIINFPEELNPRQIGSTVLWSPATYLDNPNSYHPKFKGAVPQLYTVTLTTSTGCVTVDTLLVKPYKKIKINVPTAFTPDGDGYNDVLRPVLFGFKKVNYFRVFNRWGKLVFESKDDQKGWNGKIDNVLQDMQSFIWMIEAEDVDGVVHREQGSTILLR